MSRLQRTARTSPASLGAPLAIGLLGLVISLIGITVPSVWYDEAASIISATRSWPQLWDEVGSVDAVHALYYALLHVIFDVFGYSPLTLRVPSAIAVGAAAALLVVLVRRFSLPGDGQNRLAVLAGIVFCLLPRTTWMGTEGRTYALSATLAILLTLVLVRATSGAASSVASAALPSRRWWVLYAALVVVSCVMFIYLALVVVAHGLAMLLWWWSARQKQTRTADVARRFFISAASAALLLSPFVYAVVSQSGQLSWLKPLSSATLRQVLRDQWFYTSAAFAVVGLSLLVAGIVVLGRQRRAASSHTALPLSTVVWTIVVVPTVALLLLTVFVTPIYTPRYLAMCLPFVAIAIAAAIGALGSRRAPKWVMRPRFVQALALALLVALALPQIVEQRGPLGKESSSWAAVADLIAAERAADGPDTTTAIIYGGTQGHPSATARVIAYSYPDAFEGTVDVTLDTPAFETGQLWETEVALPTRLDRVADADVVYLITSLAEDRRPATTAALAGAGFTLDEQWTLSKVHVLRYIPSAER